MSNRRRTMHLGSYGPGLTPPPKAGPGQKRRTIVGGGAPKGLGYKDRAPDRAKSASFLSRILGEDSKPRNRRNRAALVTERYLWPEWSDSEINAEKWDAGAKGKPEKGKPATPIFFEDSDGQPTLPESLAAACHQWRRIPDIYCAGGASAVFEEQSGQKPLSILQSNNHLLFSPFIRSLIGSIRSLQDYCLETDGLEDWRPWSLIYSMNKTGGKEHRPLVNPHGKYVIKLYWVGKWRKVVIDDSIPCDVNGTPLLITSSNSNEIWPLILSKALLKLSAMSLSPRNREIPEFNIITALTGWIHEVLSGSCNSTWELLNHYLPIFAPYSNSNTTAEDGKSKDKKDKKKKEDASPVGKMTAFCLAELEHAEADLHPCQVVKIRDRPLRPPSPPPIIPRWKLIRPRPDVIQQLEDMERSKIPDRWCYIRSALKVSSAEEDEDHKSVSMMDCDKAVKSANECDWMRIEDITQLENSRIHLFHRANNPSLKVIQQNHLSVSETIFSNKLHSQFFFADMRDDSQDIIVSFQVQNRKNDWSHLQSAKGAKTPVSEPLTPVPDETATPNETSSSIPSPNALDSPTGASSPLQILDTDLASAASSVLRIQNYSLKKYFQTTTDIIKNESYSQGSVRFRLPKGRTVLRFQLSATYASTISVVFDAAHADNIHFGPLDQIMPYGARVPFSWVAYGKALLDAVNDSIRCLGNRDELQTAIRKLATLTENNKDHWVPFRRAFYRLASDVLGDTAIPEDLGALRLAFRDYVPSVGPQPYFPNVKNGLTATAIDLAELENLDKEMVSVEALTAVSLIARNWRGYVARQNFDALTGNSNGAIRRQQSAKKRFEELYAKFDDSTPEHLIRLFIEEVNWPEQEIKSLSADADKTFSMSTIEGKVSTMSEGWNLLFRERLRITHHTELFPLFTEYGMDKNIKTRIRLLDDQGVPCGQILRRVTPSMVQPGHYTLVGEAEGNDTIEVSPQSSWKLQLVSSPIVTDLITPKEGGFTIRTERGPYLPPSPSSFEPGLLFRYMIGVSAPLSASFHLSVNNPSAELKLVLKDGPKELYTCGGEKSILIPSWNLTPAHNLSNPASSSSLVQTSDPIKSMSRSSSRMSKSKKSTASSGSNDSLVEIMQYTLEGHCVGNWALNPAEEANVAKLRIAAENEIRVFDHLGSTSNHSDIGSNTNKSGSRGRSMSKVPTPDTPEQATWTLRIFLDSEMAEMIELKSDNRRKEKIRAMKLAWEAAEEGRHKKGFEARTAYLQSVQGEEQDITTLLQQTQQGSIDEEPEIAMAKFRETRVLAEKYCQMEEQQRQEDIDRATKQYEQLAEREQAVFQQIQFSMNATSTMSA